MTRFYRWTVLGLILALLASAPACGDDDDDDSSDDGGDGGDDDADDDENAYQMCDETTTTLSGSDAVSALVGVSADEVLDATGGGFSVTATWSADTSLLTQSPLGGETQLTVTFFYDGGEIREVESVPNDGGGQEIAMDCLHRLEIDVTVGIETADGAFVETWPATLVQSLASGGSGLAPPTTWADFDPYALAGDFEIVSIEGEVPDAVTATFLSTATDPVAGDIQIFVEQSSGSGDEGTVSQSSHIALTWGAAS